MNIKKLTLTVAMAFFMTFAIYLQPIMHIECYAKEVKVCDTKPEEYDEDCDFDENEGIELYSETEYDTFMEAYFRNLKSNFGDNKKGSCGYVAMGMLLSYYDTYLNDDIIPEKYDVISDGDETNMNSRKCSPGILYDGVTKEECNVYGKSSVGQLTNKEYYSIMEKKANDPENPSLHAKLLTVGEKIEIFKLDGKDDQPFGLNYVGQDKVLINYLKDENLLDVFKYPFAMKSGESDKMKAEIIDYIKSGYPVLVSVLNREKQEAHACIAYDYDADEDEIYCHMGWKDDLWINYSHYKVSKKYSEFTAYVVIQPKDNVTHSHSNNYAVNGARHCYCSHNIISYKQTSHNFNYKSEINGQTHYRVCICGERLIGAHTYSDHYEKIDDSQHIAYCECGESISEMHTCYGANMTETRHEGNCKCGYKMSGKHIWTTSSDPLASNKFKVCKYCGYATLKTGGYPLIRVESKKDEEEAA